MTDQETWIPASEIEGGIPQILEATRPWVRIMSIFGFVMVGFTMFIGVSAGIWGMANGDATLVMMTALYGIVGLLYLYPALQLFRFSSRINTFLQDRTQESLAEALEQQRAFWKFVTLTMILSTAAGILLALIGGVLAAMLGLA